MVGTLPLVSLKNEDSGVQFVDDVLRLLAQDNSKGLSTLIAINCSVKQYELFCKENADTFRRITYAHANEIWVDQFIQSGAHGAAVDYLKRVTDKYNVDHAPVSIRAVRNMVFTINNNCHRAADLALWAVDRRNHGIGCPNIHTEVGYAQSLTELIIWLDLVMGNDPVVTPGQQAVVTQVMGYLAIKISYPMNAVNVTDFQAVAMLFLYGAGGNYRTPSGVWSFGTLPATDATRNRLCTLLNRGEGNANTLNPAVIPGHAALFLGHWVSGTTDPPCTAAHAAHQSYTLTIPGEAMVSINRQTQPAANLAVLLNYSINLHEVSQYLRSQLL